MEILQTLKLNKYVNKEDKRKAEILLSEGFKIMDKMERLNKFTQSFYLNPYDGNCLTQMGLILMNHNEKMFQFIGYTLLKHAFDKNYANPCIPINSSQGKFLCVLTARYFHSIHCYDNAHILFHLSNESIIKDDAQNIQLATSITGYTKSVKDASIMIQLLNKRLDKLLKKDSFELEFTKYHNLFNHSYLLLSVFNLEIYYEADFKSLMNKFYKLTLKIFPEYHYISPLLLKQPHLNKFKIGIVSAFFYPHNSVISDFSGVIDRLPRDIFDITFIYIKENSIQNENFVYQNEKHLIYDCNDEKWIYKARHEIEHLELDLLFYLDSTMSQNIQFLMMSKLARKQAVSHGHPVTSGIDSSIMDYYISWGAAELDYEISKNHYSENLILLNNDVIHQYYEPRVDINGNSIINNKCYLNITRNDFKEYIDENCNWYTCMQVPFKLHPEFDELIFGILINDPSGHIILRKTEMDDNHQIFLNRFQKIGCDLKRIHFLPHLEHHKLMALYKLSDVILDSYYAGGCTTTREALEVGAPVVTLPAKYLGGRWSYAYYNIIGINDLIASNKQHYIQIATQLGMNKEYNTIIKQKILDNIHKIFYSNEAIQSWITVFHQIILS